MAMYTGIIRAMLPVVSIEEKEGLHRLGIAFEKKLWKGLNRGDSVSISGVCLTVADMRKNIVFFDAMKETLEKTTIGSLSEESLVNVERSASYGDEIGGHAMAGHVYGMAEIVDRTASANNVQMTFQVPTEWMKYILEKGFIGLDGASLTVTDADPEAGTFVVHFIPETLRQTTFGTKQAGEKVNLEIDHMTQTIVDTTERILKK